jgi:hypothetical protein
VVIRKFLIAGFAFLSLGSWTWGQEIVVVFKSADGKQQEAFNSRMTNIVPKWAASVA